MDYIIAIGFIASIAGMIVASVWNTKKQCEEERLHSQVLYMLHEEIKRYNDKTFGEEEAECNQ